jgi:hypothetical protein
MRSRLAAAASHTGITLTACGTCCWCCTMWWHCCGGGGGGGAGDGCVSRCSKAAHGFLAKSEGSRMTLGQRCTAEDNKERGFVALRGRWW